MSIFKTISEVASVLEATRNKLNLVCSQISVLEQERLTITRAKPHTDDIAEVCRRNLAERVRSYEQSLGIRLLDTFVKGDGAAAAAGPSRSMDILCEKIDGVQRSALTAKGTGIALLPDAIIYFMRDAIAAEIPALIARLVPESANGMKADDRRRALAEVDGKITALQTQREALENDLGALRQAVSG